MNTTTAQAQTPTISAVEFYEATLLVTDAKDGLNSSHGQFSGHSFHTTLNSRATESIENLEALIAFRREQIAAAEAAIEVYRRAVEAGGPAALAASWNN